FGITFRCRDRESVARVANALASFYVEEDAKIRVRQASAARLTRLDQELAQMQEVYTTQYPDVIMLKSVIAALERVPKTTAAVGPARVVLVSYHVARGTSELAAVFARGAP